MGCRSWLEPHRRVSLAALRDNNTISRIRKMKSITSLIDYTLTWNQTKALKNTYELRFGNELVANLDFPKMLSTNAVVESGDGWWELERTGVFNVKVSVRQKDHETPVATYTPRPFKGGGIITLEDGRTLTYTTNLWQSLHELKADTGESLFEMKSQGFFKMEVEVKMYRKGLKYQELPALVMLIFYIIVLARRDAAVHSAAH